VRLNLKLQQMGEEHPETAADVVPVAARHAVQQVDPIVAIEPVHAASAQQRELVLDPGRLVGLIERRSARRGDLARREIMRSAQDKHETLPPLRTRCVREGCGNRAKLIRSVVPVALARRAVSPAWARAQIVARASANSPPGASYSIR